MITAPKNQHETARLLLKQLSGLPLTQMTGDPDGLIARASKPGFGNWLTHVAKTRGCTSPVRLRGEVLTVQASTGRVVSRFTTDDLPDRVLYKPCGTRLASRCPSCAEVYRWDTYQLIRAGLAGGKGVPESVATHPAVFVTLTAPSFGAVHGNGGKGTVKPCRPRRAKPVCEHGKPLWCNAIHSEDDWRLGQPLCLDCYDHEHHVVWNHLVGKLWSRTMLRARRIMGATADGGLRVRYAKVAEYQRRGVVHLHALVRLDGFDPDNPDTIEPPPLIFSQDNAPVPVMSAFDLKWAVEEAARMTALVSDPHPDREGHTGWQIGWGQKGLKVDVVRTGLPGGELTEQHVAGYLAKYATKGTETAGVNAARINAETIAAYADRSKHTNRLIQACWELGEPLEWESLQHWAHRLGFPGHFSTKSRRYSTTLTALRQARMPQNRIKVSAIDGNAAVLADEHDDETTLVINRWQHVGNGWRSTGDAALAAMAADAARQRQPHGLNQHQ
ncbi:replication initiation protein [Rhizocola hellebori]|uniref:Replication initiation protein n=1 Tax=Rhizocola hellebori TaxID=1392758 RepID=A0A8J3QJL8_9ACTN|nr:replication initiator [Rhizocola hellebori]GIH11776.1 replication initiation protein [Rhizocola hellebori]